MSEQLEDYFERMGQVGAQKALGFRRINECICIWNGSMLLAWCSWPSIISA
jgi:hypothetical protein